MTSLAARVAGVIRSPRATFAALARGDRTPWVDVLLLSTLVIFLANAALLSTSVGRIALLDQLERTATAFGRPVDDAAYAQMRAVSTQGIAYAAVVALTTGPALALGLAAVFYGLFGTLRRHARFATVLTVTAHASVVLALRQVVAAPINFAAETLASPTTLVRIAGSMDETSPVARVLGIVDVFVLWWIVVLAIGLAAIAGRRATGLALGLTGAYVVLAVLLALTMLATGGAA